MTDQHQTCRQCRHRMRFEFSVSDSIWAQSGCQPSEVLCIECWLERAEIAGVTQLQIGDFKFIGMAGDTLFGILHDDCGTKQELA